MADHKEKRSAGGRRRAPPTDIRARLHDTMTLAP